MKILASIMTFLILVSVVNASFISMTTKSDTVVMKNNSTDFNVTLSNGGDETAYDVKISFLFPEGFFSKPTFVGNLNQKTQYTITSNVVAENKKDGEYPFVILIEYKDANHHPFSAVSPNTIIYNTPSSSRVTATMQPIKIKDNGRLVLNIRNIDNKPHDVTIKLYLPNELVSPDSQKQISLAAGENKQESFVIENFGALDGSAYTIFAVISYENGQHYSHVASGSISIGGEIKQSKSIVDIKINDILVVALIAIITILIIYNIKLKKWRRKG